MNPNERIGVIGAGAAGVTFARALVARGFRNVTILESQGRIGGKCWTVRHRGIPYDMGATGFPGSRSPVRQLASSLGVSSTLCLRYQYMTPGEQQMLPLGLDWKSIPDGIALVRALAPLRAPGFQGHSHLAMSFSDWLKTARLTGLSEMLRPLVTGLGYGFFDDIAAAYTLKHITLFRPDVYQFLEDGIQTVIERAARALDVRLHHPVHAIERGSSVKVRAGNSDFEFDRIVITSAPRDTLRFLDADRDEQDLLRRFSCFRYHAALADIRGLPKAHFGFFPHRLKRLEHGAPVALHRRDPSSETCVIYSFLEPGKEADSATLEHAHQAHLSELGASLRNVHLHHTWDYFPHVSPHDIATGFFDRFEARQGHRNTFFAGEYLSFPTVRHVMEHAEQLADRAVRMPRRLIATSSSRSRISHDRSVESRAI